NQTGSEPGNGCRITREDIRRVVDAKIDAARPDKTDRLCRSNDTDNALRPAGMGTYPPVGKGTRKGKQEKGMTGWEGERTLGCQRLDEGRAFAGIACFHATNDQTAAGESDGEKNAAWSLSREA